jgi:ketosteroid isomerase-like protein
MSLSTWSLAAMLSGMVLSAHAASDCTVVQTQQQRQDEDTIVRIEHDWLAAEYHGSTEFLECLLMPGYRVIAPKDHVTRSKADLLERVAKNKGKTTPIPVLETMVVVNGDQATAFSLMHAKKKTGESLEVKYVDSYVFKDGVWRAVGGVDLYD